MLLVMLMHYNTATAQQQNDSILPVLTTEYYGGVTFLTKSYNYELQNKKKQLRRTARDIEIMGVGLLLGISYVGGTVTSNIGWSEWVSIPCLTVFGVSALGGLTLWSSHLRKKADAIQVETAYVLPLGEHTELGPAMFRNSNEHSMNAIGIGLKTTF